MDLDLLRQFADDHSQAAFTALVKRHVNLVYSAALRQVRSPHLAEEVAQSVFADLAREATRLKPDTILTAWLYSVARRTAVDAVRREARRQWREHIAWEMNAMNAPETDWTRIEPWLDEAMAALEEADRTAVLLRYFENKSLREVGAALGVSDDAAQKRVSRALERLREYFAERKVTVGAGALAVLISAHAVSAAPVGLALAISAASVLTVAGTAATTTATTTATATVAAAKTIVMTTMQKAIVTTALALAAGVGIYAARQAAVAQRTISALQQAEADWGDQIRQLQTARNAATNRLAALAAENARLQSNNVELLKLRGEVTQLRKAAQDLAAVKAASPAVPNSLDASEAALLDRVRRLKDWFERMPGAKIPEMQFLKGEDWLAAAQHKLDTEDDYRTVAVELRSHAQGKFMEVVYQALSKYLAANQNHFPSEVAQLAPYFETYPGDELLQRYQIVPSKSVPQDGIGPGGGEWLITPKETYGDMSWLMGTTGTSAYSVTNAPLMDVLAPAIKAALADAPSVNGRKNVNLNQLQLYLTTPEEKAAYDKLIKVNHPSP